MSEDLTPRQQILLWDLISRGGSALQKDLKPEVKPADREPLVRAKLILVAKQKSGALQLSVEEPGWNHIASVAPALLKTGDGSKYDRPVLQFVLASVQAYAAAKGVPYAGIFAQKTGEASEEATSRVSSEPSPMPIHTAIRSAFFDIAGRPARNQVRLRQLREHLPGIARDELDNALIRMREAGQARFSTLSNPPDIAEEGDAALTIRDQQFHTIWIGP